MIHLYYFPSLSANRSTNDEDVGGAIGDYRSRTIPVRNAELECRVSIGRCETCQLDAKIEVWAHGLDNALIRMMWMTVDESTGEGLARRIERRKPCMDPMLANDRWVCAVSMTFGSIRRMWTLNFSKEAADLPETSIVSKILGRRRK